MPVTIASPWVRAPRRTVNRKPRVLNVPPDVYDLRDRVYMPRLMSLPSRYAASPRAPVRDQGSLGACTGFAMAAVVNYLYRKQRASYEASPRFLYENAKRYDEWKGVEYEGSSIRGALKGFLRHGVCREQDAPFTLPRNFDPNRPFPPLPDSAYQVADQHPLGAYYRITRSSINDLQSAIVETGAVLVSAQVHAGWDEPRSKGKGLARIPWAPGAAQEGGHAFALVGYDGSGFLVHNSWGVGWGTKGWAHLSYEDWLENGVDAWVAQIGAGCVTHNYPRLRINVERGFQTHVRAVEESHIHGHYLAIRNGAFDEYGEIRTVPGDIDGIVRRMAESRAGGDAPLPVLIFAHGGLVDESGASHKALWLKRELFEKHGIFPLHLVWHTSLMEEVIDLVTAKQRKIEVLEPGLTRGAGEWLQSAMDGALEAAVRIPGAAIWKAMKEDAETACRCVATLLDAISAAGLPVEYHLAGHSAGSVLHCHLLDDFARRRIPVESLTFLAPAVSTRLFVEKAKPRIDANKVRRFAVHTMEDGDERADHCAAIYHKSLLYLVSHSFEDEGSDKLVGLARHVWKDHRGNDKDVDPDLAGWLSPADPRRQLVLHKPALQKTGATLHGSFDDDPAAMQALVERILGDRLAAPPAIVGPATGVVVAHEELHSRSRRREEAPVRRGPGERKRAAKEPERKARWRT